MITGRKFLFPLVFLSLLALAAGTASAQRAKTPVVRRVVSPTVRTSITTTPASPTSPTTTRATISTAPKYLSWSLTDGTPSLTASHHVGFFIWHDANFVYVVTKDESAKGQIFSGAVRTEGGPISDVSGFRNEQDGRYTQSDANNLRFHFQIHEPVDGVKFRIGAETHRIGFHFELAGHPNEHVFLGKLETEPTGGFENGYLIFDIEQKTTGVLPWSLTYGRPTIAARHQVGFFIWHDAHFVYLVETDEGQHGRIFNGDVRLRDGHFGGMSGLYGESDNRFTLHSPDFLSFRFPTHEEIDGVKFEISTASKFISIYLELQGRQNVRVFLGHDQHEVPGGFHGQPLYFDLSK